MEKPALDKPLDGALVWLRRDLRCDDNAALHHALQSCGQVFCLFVFDRGILDALPRADRRVEFLRESLVDLDRQLGEAAKGHGVAGAGLIVRHGAAADCLSAIARDLAANAIFFNHDDEPQSLARDTAVQALMQADGVAVHSFKDHLIFERAEVLTLAGKPYSVFTPYKNAWLKKIDSFYLKPYPTEKYAAALAPRPANESKNIPELDDLGFKRTNFSTLKIPAGARGGQQLFSDFQERIDQYDETRNFPAVKGPSYLGIHLRFGTVSIRQIAAVALKAQIRGSVGASTWLSELIWRDFYGQILSNFPHVACRAFKPEYEAIAWESGDKAEALFKAWCDGQTGYPLVDAAMAQINQTGYMHNRLRMVVGSFLVKDLGIDWRWGEKYFAQHLNDFDLSANNGGWQWVASSGCDAQPYFRIFNPLSQSEKFDPQGKFIRRYLPQLAGLPADAIHAPWLCGPLELQSAGVVLGKNYPGPIVAHDAARASTMARYAVVRKATGASPSAKGRAQ